MSEELRDKIMKKGDGSVEVDPDGNFKTNHTPENEKIGEILDDMDNNPKLRDALEGNSGLVEARDVLDSDKTLRKDPEALQKIDDFRKKEYKGPPSEKYPDGEDLTKRADDAADGVDMDLLDEKSILEKQKKSFEEAKNQGGEEGARRFVEGKTTKVLGSQDLKLGKLSDLMDKPTGLKTPEGKIITYRDINIGYSGVMSPDGKVGFRLTIDDQKLKELTGKDTRWFQQEGLPTLKSNFKSSDYPEIDNFSARNGSHATLQEIGFEGEKNLWGFAINLDSNGQIEIGYYSGQINRVSSNGRMPFNGDILNTDSHKRAEGILNRTDQKKLKNYLESMPEFDNNTIIPKSPAGRYY